MRGCENNNTIWILTNEFGFQGFAMHVRLVRATFNDQRHEQVGHERMTMPGDIAFRSNTSYYGANLTAYCTSRKGRSPKRAWGDMATRILT
jgi:hypothetical protein